MDIQKTMQNLEKNGIKPYFVENKDEVVPLVKTLINNGESVSCGGSVTLDETGVKALMQNGDYDFIDRTGFYSCHGFGAGPCGCSGLCLEK